MAIDRSGTADVKVLLITDMFPPQVGSDFDGPAERLFGRGHEVRP